MKKRLQIILTEEAWKAVEELVRDANTDNKVGSIHYSDAINEMILCSKVDPKTLQYKHADVRKTLRSLASNADIDIDSAIKSLSELRGKTLRRSGKTQGTFEEVV